MSGNLQGRGLTRSADRAETNLSEQNLQKKKKKKKKKKKRN